MMERVFLRHPRDVGESYGQHLLAAAGFGARMIGGGMACLLHGLVPALFTSTGSRTVERLHRRMVVARRRAGDPAEWGAGAPHPAPPPVPTASS